MANTPAVPFAHQPPLITILSDHASQDRSEEKMAHDAIATQADRDQLNLETRLASTFDILRHKNTRCPLAVAVYGDWGTGKTSAMRWLETRLNEWNSLPAPKRKGHPRAYPVWFDPWRYHSKEEVWRGIIAEVILALIHVGHLNQENILPRMVQAVKKFGGFLGRSFIHAVANMEFEAGGKGKVPGLAEAEVKFAAKGEMFRDIWEEYDKAAHPHKAHLNQFEETLRTWVTDFLGPQAASEAKPSGVLREPARLVLFIDDLDRCLPEVTLEVIEALKLYLNIDHLIFVVGLDETVVRSVVAEHYKKAGVDSSKAARYLDKVFQVDVRIPPSEAQMPGYMKTQITALNEATDHYWQTIMDRSGHRLTLESVLISLARNNPREVKRLLNSALLRGRAASLDVKLSDDKDCPDEKKQPQDHSQWQEDKKAERFAQGVQLFLLQRLLADRLLQSEDLLTYSQHLKWFAEASRLLRVALVESEFGLEELMAYLPRVKDTVNLMTGVLMKWEDHDLTPDHPMKPEGAKACTALLSHLNTAPPKPDSALWTSALFLQLLQVPFSQAVAEHFPPSRATEKSASEKPLDLTQLPDFMREALAWAAEVSIDELKFEHLAKITELSLADSPVFSGLLKPVLSALSLKVIDLTLCLDLEDCNALAGQRHLETLDLTGCRRLHGTASFQGISGLLSLKELYLSGCSGLKDCSSLTRLQQLETLSLSDCKGLQGTFALQGLFGLQGLKELRLIGCTGLGAETLRELRQLLPETCIIYGPDGDEVFRA
jgi:KAP family P-loop domain